MAKWYGKVGYVSTEEVAPGVWDPNTVTEYPYYGDVLEYTSRWSSSNQVNDNRDITARISIMADPYAYEHFSKIKYAEFMDALWEVKSATPQRPRIILTLGGVWNGK